VIDDILNEQYLSDAEKAYWEKKRADAISGLSGQEASVQFFVGPSAMDMAIGEALVRYVVIMLIIGIMFSVMAMSLSQITHSTIPVVAFLMLLWLMSMVNIPDSLGILARIWSFMPVTFLGSWNFNDYHLVPVFGHLLTNIEATPIIFLS